MLIKTPKLKKESSIKIFAELIKIADYLQQYFFDAAKLRF